MKHETQQKESRQGNNTHSIHSRQKDKHQNRVTEYKSRIERTVNTVRESATDLNEAKAKTTKGTNYLQPQQKNMIQGPLNTKQRDTQEHQAQQTIPMLYTQIL